MRTHYYCTNIAQAILNEHFDIIRTLEKAKAPKLVSFTFVLPQSIELFLKDKQWNEKVFAGSVQYEYKDLVAGFFVREFADEPDVRKKFPHMNCYRKKEAMPLDQFVKSALALETALKAEDALFLM